MKPLQLFIGNKRYSSWSFRPWILLKTAGIPFREARLWIRQPDSGAKIDRVSPGGRVPALKDGSLTVWESTAICEYLAEKFPAKFLWPADTRDRAVARSISHEMHAGFQGLRSNLPCHFTARYKNFMIPPDARPDIVRVLQIWKECRRKHARQGAFLFGKFSVADAMYAPVVFRFLAYGVKLDSVCRQYMNDIESLPASREWVKEASKEAMRIPAYEYNETEQRF